MTTQTIGTRRARVLARSCHRLCRSASELSSSRTSMTRRSQQDPGVRVHLERPKMHFLESQRDLACWSGEL